MLVHENINPSYSIYKILLCTYSCFKRNGIKYSYNNYWMLNIITGGEIVNILNEKRYVWFAGEKYITTFKRLSELM